MTLDVTIKVLQLTMQDRLSEVEQSMLADAKIQELLVGFFVEKEQRPELVSLIQIPELIKDYLSLSLDERAELEQFRLRNPEYFEGQGDDGPIHSIKSKKSIKPIARKIRWTKQLLTIFDFYLVNHKEVGVFNQNYIKKNKQLRAKFGNIGNSLCMNAYKNYREKEGINYIVKLVAQQRPEILEYWRYEEKKKFVINQAVQDLIIMFDFYLKNRKESEIFNPNYFKINKKLKIKFGSLGERLYHNAHINRGKGGINYIVKLAAQQRPDILQHWAYEKHNKFKIDQAVQDLLKIFEFYLKIHRKSHIFNPNYLKINKQIKTKFGNLGKNLCHRAYINYRKEGGIQKIVELASKQRPEILKYWRYEEKKKFDLSRAVQDLAIMFDFYLEARKEGEVFSSWYLIANKQLKAKFGNLGDNLYKKANYNHSFEYLIEHAAKLRPELREYTTSANVLKIDGPKQLIRMFDFYLKTRKDGEVFNITYLQINKKLKKRYGNLGRNLYQNVLKNLKEEGGIQKIVQLASIERPEILQYWSYEPRKARRAA